MTRTCRRAGAASSAKSDRTADANATAAWSCQSGYNRTPANGAASRYPYTSRLAMSALSASSTSSVRAITNAAAQSSQSSHGGCCRSGTAAGFVRALTENASTQRVSNAVGSGCGLVAVMESMAGRRCHGGVDGVRGGVIY